jgi:DNA primase
LVPDAKIAEIRERADIVEIVGEYVALKKAGVNHKGVCPFHADTDPSFNVNPARQFFHCFGCSASGDVFGFLQRIEGLDFMEAVERLAARYGVELPKPQANAAARSAEERAREAGRRRRFVLEEAAAFFEAQLATPAAAAARKMLADRAIDADTTARFRLGYAQDAWDGLLEHLRAKRIAPREAEEAGLAIPRKTGGGYYDRFRNRLVFTVTDPAGHPIAFSARSLGAGDEEGAKYINSPETADYHKGRVLFGLHQARVAMSKAREAVLVEGNFDVLSLARAGVENVVAPLGTALTEEHAAILRRRVDRVVVLFDGDRAGRAAAARAFPVLARAGLAAYFAPLPDGEDPDSLVRKRGAGAVREILAKPRGLLDEIIRASAEAADGTAQDAARRIGKLRDFLDAVREPMERDLYRQRVAEAFSVKPEFVFRHLRSAGGVAAGGEPMRPGGPAAEAEPGLPEERELVGLLLDVPELCEEALAIGAVGMISAPRLHGIAEGLALKQKRKESLVAEMMAGAADDPAIAWLARRGMRQLFSDAEIGRKALHEIFLRMKKRRIDAQIKDLKQLIRKAHSSGDDQKALSLQRQKTELEKEIRVTELGFDKGGVAD